MVRQVWIPGGSGPLAGPAAGYRSWLEEQSYSRSSISDRLWHFAQLSRWLEDERLGVAGLTSAVGERFVASRRAAGQVTLVARPSMRLPLEYLRLTGAAPRPVIDLCLKKCTKWGLKYPTTVGGLWGILP